MFVHFIHASKYSFLSLTVIDKDSPEVPCINTPTFPIIIYKQEFLKFKINPKKYLVHPSNKPN